MPTYRLKHTFTAGEISPLMASRVDFDRYKHGCKKLYNMVCMTQGPVERRPGLEFAVDLDQIGQNPNNRTVRLVPFIFNELQSYCLLFYHYKYSTDTCQAMVVATTDENGEIGLLADPAGWRGSCGAAPTDAYTLDTKPPAGISKVIDNIVWVRLPSGFDVDEFDYDQSADELWIAQTGVKPMVIRRTGLYCWWAVNIYNQFTAPPADWNDANGWPERITFHQQRVIWGANGTRRQTVWTSVAGDFLDYTASPVTEASNGVAFTLDSGTQNRIQWMISIKSLNIGTLADEWTVSGGVLRGSITPEEVFAERHTNDGSEPNKPLLVGLTTLFIGRHGRTVNEFVYDYTLDSYKTSDMTVLASHLTEQSSIVDWAYQQIPHSIIWCVRDDGALLGLTYQRQHKVVGWHHHATNGQVKAIASIPGRTREDDVWVVVRRQNSTGYKYYLEKMANFFTGTRTEDGRFLDSFTQLNAKGRDFVDGVTHLSGQTVHILADGTVHPPRTVSSSGFIQLNANYTDVIVGHPYTSEVRPYLSEVVDEQGIIMGKYQSIVELEIDFYKTLGIHIGRTDAEDSTDYDQEEQWSFRKPEHPMGEPVPLFTGLYQVSFMEGVSSRSEYYIRQKQPLPLTVRSVIDSVEVFE